MNEQHVELAEAAGGFIHEIKNHLSTLGLNLQLLTEDFQEPQTQRERRALTRIQRLQGECQRLVELANDFLRFARITDLSLEEVEMGKVVEEMLDFFGPTARAANIEIKTFIPADLPPLLLDVQFFKQALLNLLLNAEQAMPEGGELIIQAAAEGTGSDPTRPQQRTVVFQVIDTGEGIRPDLCAKVFQPFFSTKKGGTGLGLPMVRRIVEAHGGSITVQSEPGRGTNFTIRLPACARVPALA